MLLSNIWDCSWLTSCRCAKIHSMMAFDPQCSSWSHCRGFGDLWFRSGNWAGHCKILICQVPIHTLIAWLGLLYIFGEEKTILRYGEHSQCRIKQMFFQELLVIYVAWFTHTFQRQICLIPVCWSTPDDPQSHLYISEIFPSMRHCGL